MYGIFIDVFNYSMLLAYRGLLSFHLWVLGNEADISLDSNDYVKESQPKDSESPTIAKELSVDFDLKSNEKSVMLNTESLINLAKSQRGKPYNQRLWKSHEVYDLDPVDFDCSAFNMWCYFRQGFKIPRTSQEQADFCNKISIKLIKPGDLLFFSETRSIEQVDHTSMYMGGGMCVEAAGGRAGKVIFSWMAGLIEKPEFVMVGRVPLDKAEDKFFAYVKRYPKTKKKGGDSDGKEKGS